MTKLQCSAVHCEYNADSKCCRPDIQVDGGHEAKVPHETRCASFRERSQKATNRAESYCHPDNQLKVACTATKCEYNCHGDCVAKAIKIGGASAYCSSDTECNTFSNGGPCKMHCR